MNRHNKVSRLRIDRLGLIHRARGYRLYNRHGRRYLDLWQSGGRSLLGHRPQRSLVQLKGVLSQGANAGLPSIYERRLIGYLSRLTPGFEPFVTSSDAAVREILDYLGIRWEDLYDPALDPEPADAYAAGVWRPIAGPEPLPASWRAVVPILPSTIGQVPAVICVRLPHEDVTGLTALLPSEPQPAVLLSAAVAGLEQMRHYSCASWVQEAWPDPEGCPGWKRRGPYVATCCEADVYDTVFDQFLREGVLLSPIHPGPSILPATVSAGEAAMLMRLFAG